jgi:flagellar motor switch protein FliM
MHETLSWISLSNGLTTLTSTTTTTSTCPFHIYFREIRINVEIFLPRQGAAKSKKKRKDKNNFQKKSKKKWKKKLPKKIKNIKVTKKN